MPTIEEVTPPISPARAETGPATPSPVQRPGRGRGHGKWCTQRSETPSVGTRSKSKLVDPETTQAQASHAMWPEKQDKSAQITRMARDLRLHDPPEDRHTRRTSPRFRTDETQKESRPPAAGIHNHHRDIYIILPPRAGGGVVGASTPVSTAPLGLIHSVDPLLATQLHEDPAASLAVRDTRLRVLSTIRLVRTGLVGQLAALQQWEEVLHSQGGQ